MDFDTAYPEMQYVHICTTNTKQQHLQFKFKDFKFPILSKSSTISFQKSLHSTLNIFDCQFTVHLLRIITAFITDTSPVPDVDADSNGKQAEALKYNTLLIAAKDLAEFLRNDPLAYFSLEQGQYAHIDHL